MTIIPAKLHAWMPKTAMADAFTIALVHKVSASAPSTEIMLPIGLVTAGEIALVLRGLGLIQKEADAH